MKIPIELLDDVVLDLHSLILTRMDMVEIPTCAKTAGGRTWVKLLSPCGSRWKLTPRVVP